MILKSKNIITCLYNITLAHMSSVNIKEKPYKATLILEKGMCSMLGEGGGGGLPPEITSVSSSIANLLQGEIFFLHN